MEVPTGVGLNCITASRLSFPRVVDGFPAADTMMWGNLPRNEITFITKGSVNFHCRNISHCTSCFIIKLLMIVFLHYLHLFSIKSSANFSICYGHLIKLILTETHNN